MTDENAAQVYRGSMKERYSGDLTKINDEGAIRLQIEFFRTSRQADVDAIVDKIKKLGASEIYPHVPQAQMNWYPSIVCYVPYDKIKDLAKDERIARINVIVPPMTRYVPKITEGDAQLLADQARAQFSVDGSGIKVGVISDGIQGYNEPDRRQYELPSSISYLAGHENMVGSEGLAMWEIIHDIAPGASLHFASSKVAPGTPESMAQHITSLRSGGCKAIVDDVIWFGAPMFIDDELCNTITWEVEQHGITYLCAAGNEATQMWGGTYDNLNGWHVFKHEGGLDYTDNSIYGVPTGKQLKITLQWADDWDDANDNYDLYLYDPSFNPIGTGGHIVQANGNNQHPQEIVEFTNSASLPYVILRIKG